MEQRGRQLGLRAAGPKVGWGVRAGKGVSPELWLPTGKKSRGGGLEDTTGEDKHRGCSVPEAGRRQLALVKGTLLARLPRASASLPASHPTRGPGAAMHQLPEAPRRAPSLMCVRMCDAEVTAPISLCRFLTEQELGEADWKPASPLSSPLNAAGKPRV